MANGDGAAAAGLAVFSGVQDHALGYDNDNVRGDELAAHMVDGGHPWSKITSKPSTFPASSNSVGTAQLKDEAVTFSKISPGAVTRTRIADGAVGVDQIGSEAVNNARIADGAVTGSKIAAGTITRSLLADSVIGTDQMANNSVTGAKIDSNAVGSAQIQSGAVGMSELSGEVQDAIEAGGTADGPTSAAYSRNAQGSGRYAVWMNSDLEFMRNTSSRRYKEQIEDAEIDPAAVLNLRPVTYHRKNDQTGEREFGLIAEEVQDAGLEDLVVWYDGQIDGVRYDLVAVSLLSVVKDQAARIATLERAVAALTAPEVPEVPEEPVDDETTGEGA